MADVEDQLSKKKPFKKKTFRSYLSLDETLDDTPSAVLSIEQLIPGPGIQAENVSKAELTKTLPITQESSVSTLVAPPSVDTRISEIGVLKENSNNKPELRNDSVTIAKQLRNDSITNPKQLRNDYETITKQLRNKNNETRNDSVTNEEHIRNQSVTGSVTIAKQLRNNSVTDFENHDVSLMRLSGHRLSLINAIFDLCRMHGSMTSGAVTREKVIEMTNISSEVLRVTAYRLECEGYLRILESKTGRGGWTNYEINPVLYNQLTTDSFRNNSVTSVKQFRNNSVTELATEPVTLTSSKIDSNFKNNLTNYLGSPVAKKETWFMDLDFSNVHPIKATHVNSSIRDLVQTTLEAEVVQNFLDRYMSWMTTQDTSKIKNPIALFCEKLKDFATIRKSDVEDCLTDAERRAEVEFMVAVNKAKAEMDLIKKSKDLQTEMEFNERLENQFSEWFEITSDQEKLSLCEPSGLAPLGSDYYKTALKAAYKEKAF